MIKTLLFLLWAMSPVVCFGQVEAFVESAKKECFDEDIKLQMKDFDFTSLIFPNDDFLGFIGSQYHRIKVFYTSVQKAPSDPMTYQIKGVTVVSNNKCDFEGTISIEGVYRAKNMHYGVDLIYKEAGFQSQGIMIANYLFKEDPKQNHVGTFAGKMIIWYLIDRNGILRINDVNAYSDSYRNNQHIGTWTEYGSTKSKPCNWGVRNIPDSGDLNIGAGFFSVNPRYKDRGWDFEKDF
jgi:hypothetical protein